MGRRTPTEAARPDTASGAASAGADPVDAGDAVVQAGGRGVPDDGKPHASAVRSARDLELLRSLARRIDPQDAGAHNNLGVVYYQKGLYAEAITEFEQALELDPRMQVARRNLEIAYFHTGYFEQLVEDLRGRLEEDPADTEARAELARAYRYAGDATTAIREWKQILEQRPDDVEIRLEMARAELEGGSAESALDWLRRAAELAPDDPAVQLQLGEVHYNLGRSAESREALERALEQDEDLAPAYHLLAFVYGDLGETELAANAGQRAAELNPSYTKAETNLSLDRYSEDRYDELVGERGPRPQVAEGMLAHYNLGLAFRQRGLYEEALREFGLALDEGEDPFLVRQAEAELHLLRGEAEEAERWYADLVEQEPESPKLWNERGVGAHQRGELDEAEEAYRRALKLDSDYSLAWNNLGVVCHHHGDAEGAAEAFRAALSGGRAPADVWRNLALMQSRNGQDASSMKAYRKALDLEPDSAVAWSGLGAALMQGGKVAEARGAFVRAVESDPDLAEARYHLAFALAALGDYPGALRETKRALHIDPIFPAPRFRLLIDLQFEEARVLAPDLDVTERIQGASGVQEFEFDPDALDDLFGGDDAGAALDSMFAGSGPGGDAALAAPAEAGNAPADPDVDVEGLLSEAREALAKGYLGEAQQSVQRATMAGVHHRELSLLQGEIFLRRGFAGEALERFGAVLRDAGDDDVRSEGYRRRAYLGRARSLLRLERLEEAREAAETLVGMAADDTAALRVLGEVLIASADASEAIKVLERSRALDPDHPGILTDLGTAYSENGDDETAEEVLRRAIEVDRGAVAARTKLGQVLVAAGRRKEAAREYRVTLEILPTYGEAALSYAQLERQDGNLKNAIHVLADLLTADPYHLDALVQLGTVLYEADRPSEAATALRRVLRLDPEHGAARAAMERLFGNAIAAGSK